MRKNDDGASRPPGANGLVEHLRTKPENIERNLMFSKRWMGDRLWKKQKKNRLVYAFVFYCKNKILIKTNFGRKGFISNDSSPITLHH